jgi:hypothetical protein
LSEESGVTRRGGSRDSLGCSQYAENHRRRGLIDLVDARRDLNRITVQRHRDKPGAGFVNAGNFE